MSRLFIFDFLRQFPRCMKGTCFCVERMQRKSRNVTNPWIELKYEIGNYTNCYTPQPGRGGKYQRGIISGISSWQAWNKIPKKEHLKKGSDNFRAKEPEENIEAMKDGFPDKKPN